MSTNENAQDLVLKLCNSIKNKNWKEFIGCFNTANHDWKFVDILPGGKVIEGSQELIDLHTVFFQSDETRFMPLSGDEEFKESSFLYKFSWDNVCQFLIEVRVTKPLELSQTLGSDSTQLISINNILAITVAFDEKSNRWWPVCITNTVVDEAC